MNNTNFYIGTVSGIPENKELRQILIDIPGLVEGAVAYPKSTELDEPKIGDPVLVLSLDPIFNSYFIYEKLKENEFIGFRASGKMVSITPDYVKIAVYDKDTEFKDSEEPSEDSLKAVITVKDNGDVDIESSGQVGIYGLGNESGKTASLEIGNSVFPGYLGPMAIPGSGPFFGGCNCPYGKSAVSGNKLTNIGGKSL